MWYLFLGDWPKLAVSSAVLSTKPYGNGLVLPHISIGRGILLDFRYNYDPVPAILVLEP